jgi:hypothetical protein
MEPWERRMLAQDLAVLERWRSRHADDLRAANKDGDKA